VIDADLIVVLESGRLVESDTHVDLLSLGGVYAMLVPPRPHLALDPAPRHSV